MLFSPLQIIRWAGFKKRDFFFFFGFSITKASYSFLSQKTNSFKQRRRRSYQNALYEQGSCLWKQVESISPTVELEWINKNPIVCATRLKRQIQRSVPSGFHWSADVLVDCTGFLTIHMCCSKKRFIQEMFTLLFIIPIATKHVCRLIMWNANYTHFSLRFRVLQVCTLMTV